MRNLTINHKYVFFFASFSLAFSLLACSSEDGADDAEAVTQDDVVNVDDLLAEIGGTGGVKVGDPAQLWDEAVATVKGTVGHVRGILEKVKVTVQAKDPAIKGKTKLGQPYGIWKAEKDGVSFRFVAIRTAPGRVRYALWAAKGSVVKGILTGIFVKKAPRVGGGRLHLNITGANELWDAPASQGAIHVFFANHKNDAHARRIVYRNFTKKDDKAGVPWNFGVDLIRFPGKGGRLRSLGVGNILQNPDTVELAALRVLWKTGVGGRADGAMVHLWPKPVKPIGVMHECWDGKNLRTAYMDSVAANDADNPNAGDPKESAKCGGFDQDEVKADGLSADASDTDPELDALLKDAGADSLDETEAGLAVDPEKE